MLRTTSSSPSWIRPLAREHAALNALLERVDELISDASELGVRMVACEMTMGLMDTPKEKLRKEVSDIGGVGTYLDAASKGHVNLFI